MSKVVTSVVLIVISLLEVIVLGLESLPWCSNMDQILVITLW